MHGTRVSIFLSLISIGGASLCCQIVKLDQGAGEVRVLANRDSIASHEQGTIAGSCRELGKTKVQVLSKLGFFARSPEKVARELDVLARNAAADLGGNAVLATGGVDAGARRYRVLRCPLSS